ARDALAALGAEPAFIQRAADAFLVLDASGAADATAAIEALASERGEWGIVLAKQAELRLVAGEPDAALALYERAGELGGVPPGWLALGRGTTLRRLGRNEEALASYQEGLGHAPGLVRLQVRIRELTLHDRLAECAALVADNRPAAALPMLGDLLVHVPGDASVQAQALQVQRAISGLSTGDMAPALADAHRELDLFETVLQHLERDRAPS